jgi:hypothetical protein
MQGVQHSIPCIHIHPTDERVEYCAYEQWKRKHHGFRVTQLKFLTVLNDVNILILTTTNLM